MRRIDLDTIHFATGSADVSMNEAASMKRIADAMKKIIDKNPGETFLIEGHTDAVGADQANLVLSDRRAESVAITLSELYNIPPENLVTQGYGERFLKVQTSGPSAENRRVTIRASRRSSARLPTGKANLSQSTSIPAAAARCRGFSCVAHSADEMRRRATCHCLIESNLPGFVSMSARLGLRLHRCLLRPEVCPPSC